MAPDSKTDKEFAEFGPRLLQEFLFDPQYKNLNNGSFGSFPRAILEEQRRFQDAAEARPDSFIRYEMPKLIDAARATVAQLLKVPTDTVVFEPNATNAVNTILRNLVWADDGKDEILYFNSIYGSSGKTIDYLVDTIGDRVASREITITYPCEDEAIVAAFEAAVAQSRAEGRRPRLCLYDAVSSLPGVRFPFEALTAACRAASVTSVLDGAQGIGMLDLDVGELDPDFFFTNCHKWLHTPRGCAALYVPHRHQHLITSTTPTSHGYEPRTRKRFNPLPNAGNKSAFVRNFEFTGTADRSAYVCVPAAVAWRRDVLGGEARIRAYTQGLARAGGARAAEVLGTEVLDNKAGTMSACSMTNVRLPLRLVEASAGDNQGQEGEKDISVSSEDAPQVREWMMKTLIDEYKTYVVLYRYGDKFWARISAQVYLDVSDFEWAGQVLLELSRRAAKGEYKNT